jgi:hypothetical protein
LFVGEAKTQTLQARSTGVINLLRPEPHFTHSFLLDVCQVMHENNSLKLNDICVTAETGSHNTKEFSLMK